MTDYERKIKADYERAGYEFRYDTIGVSVQQVNRKIAYEHGLPYGKIFAVQGETVAYDEVSKQWHKRFLVFSRKDRRKYVY